MEFQIQPACAAQARPIARLIMLAMNYECCQYFAGPHHTLTDFEDAMTRLVTADESQYSWRNTLVALDAERNVAGVCVTYDGGQLHRLREAFLKEARESFGRDFSDIDDETQAGELYLDSLAVRPDCQKKGIATALLKASIQRAKELGLPRVGLLVDQGNPSAEHLYHAVGFTYANDATWGGHPMRHLVYNIER